MSKKRFSTSFASYMVLVCALPLAPLDGATNQIRKGEMAGFLYAPANEVSPGTLSNGLVKLCIDSQAGTYDLIDLQRNEAFVKNAEVAPVSYTHLTLPTN